jgi:hypothetical protein
LKAPDTGVSASHRAGRPLNTEPIALPSHHQTGVTQSRLLSPTTFKLVEHLGNAGRPHADANRAHTHLQPHPATDGQPRRAHLLTRQPHTGNAGLGKGDPERPAVPAPHS